MLLLLLLLLLLSQLRDPRVPASSNDTFLDMLEGYFSRSEQDKQAEARPHLAYQVRQQLTQPLANSIAAVCCMQCAVCNAHQE
jgi:hypothetical protein